jgi:hypothetical protein
VLDFLQPIFPSAFAIMWFGGVVVLCLRFCAKQRTYLRRFPPVAGVPRGMHPGGHPWASQDDLEVDRLRRAVLRSYRQAALWALGFPLLTCGLAALLIVAGLVHPH